MNQGKKIKESLEKMLTILWKISEERREIRSEWVNFQWDHDEVSFVLYQHA